MKLTHDTRIPPVAAIGIDIGDRQCDLAGLNDEKEVVFRRKIQTTPQGISRMLGGLPATLITIEVGTHSPWISRLIEELGHEVLIANPGQVPLIYKGLKKSDRADAELLARLTLADPKLLSPVRHRGVEAQKDRARLNCRDALVKTRAGLTNRIRGIVKSLGYRIPSGSTAAMPKRVVGLPSEIRGVIEPLVSMCGQLTAKIKQCTLALEARAKSNYPETENLRQVNGVGLLTSLAFVVTIEDPRRFSRSRKVPAYLGLAPKLFESSDQKPQTRISKQGDAMTRRLLVSSAQYILGPFGSDCRLRTFGLELAERGGKNAKKRAVIAVARKLAILLHRLWLTGKIYDPDKTTVDPRTAPSPGQRSQARELAAN